VPSSAIGRHDSPAPGEEEAHEEHPEQEPPSSPSRRRPGTAHGHGLLLGRLLAVLACWRRKDCWQTFEAVLFCYCLLTRTMMEGGGGIKRKILRTERLPYGIK
jgi:hypothetical protein